MPDHFAALAQPRRPWLEADALKEHFHRASSTCHPDVPGSGDAARFAALNLAYGTLGDPVRRLRHLLELEAPEQLTRPQVIPPDFADLFMRLAELRGALDAFHKKETAAPGALARALLTDDLLALRHRAVALRAELDSAHEAALAALRTLDAEWEPRAAEQIERLAALHQQLAYLSKWRAQLAESLFKLSS
jgi:curved DNA-binding protein CbpA